MPRDNNRQTEARDLRLWLAQHGHTNLYGDWLNYCVTNSDSSTTLHEWLAANHPNVWKEYKSGS